MPKFAGWLAVYQGTGEADESERTERPAPDAGDRPEDDDDGSSVLPVLTEGRPLELRALKPEQKFTQPPPRYNEGTLVKALEENGIGRPSTYASIISVLQARDYVNKIEGRFKPTILGRCWSRSCCTRRSTTSSTSTTRASIEEELDEIEKGNDELRDDARRASTRSSRRI